MRAAQHDLRRLAKCWKLFRAVRMALHREGRIMNSMQINCFLEAAECQSFSKAAEKIHISQPALSKNIAALEKELTVQLFERDHFQAVRLTRGGKLFYTKFKKWQGEIGEIIEMAHEADKYKEKISVLDNYLVDGDLIEFFNHVLSLSNDLKIVIEKKEESS